MLKRNVTANLFGQIYIAIIAILVTPYYLTYLGPEAYGLVGFFILLQSWMALLDVGLTPTFARQVAYMRGTKNDYSEFVRLLRSFEIIFFFLIIFIFCFGLLINEWVAVNWINIEHISVNDVSYCILIMVMIIGVRWLISLYRSGINGFEKQVWLNCADIVITTFRYVGAFFLLRFVTTEIIHFFEYQLLVSIFAVFLFMSKFYNCLSINPFKIGVVFDVNKLKEVMPFALGIAYTSSIWIILTESDKLILSKILNLGEFGYFSLVVLIASSINMLSSPITRAVFPRLTLLIGHGEKSNVITLYRNTTQVVVLISSSAVFIISFFSEKLLYTWSGNMDLAIWGRKVLFWLVLGNGVLCINGLLYYLQSAFGNLRLHVIGSTISAIIQLPILLFFSFKFGVFGAVISRFCFRLIWFVWWTPIIHKKFLPGIHLKWILVDVVPVLLSTSGVSYMLYMFFNFNKNIEDTRVDFFYQLLLSGILVLIIGSFFSNYLRKKWFLFFKVCK